MIKTGIKSSPQSDAKDSTLEWSKQKIEKNIHEIENIRILFINQSIHWEMTITDASA